MSDGNRRKENKIIDGCEEERKADDSENVDSKDDLVGDTTDYISAEELQFLSKANSPINNISNNSNNSGGDGKIPIAENQALANTASLLSDEVSDDDQLYHEKNPEDVENAEIDEEDGKENQLVEEVEVRPLLPKRHVLLLMIFLGFAVVYSLRVNINVAIVAMVNNRTSITRSGKISVHVAEFDWDSRQQGKKRKDKTPLLKDFWFKFVAFFSQYREIYRQKNKNFGLVLGSFFYGYWVLQVPGAWIAMKLGATRIFGYGVFLSSLMALLTPVATRYHLFGLVGVRIVQGIFLGVTYPCTIAIWAKWAPPFERSTMVTMAIAGSPVGNIIAMPLTALLAKYGFDGGWPTVFYFFGFLGCLWYLAWEFCIYDTPETHPTISKKEKRFITKSIAEKPFDPLTESPPWGAIFTSIPMWGIIIGHFGACWGYYTLFTQMPTYLKDIQHLDIKTMGLVAAIPYLFKAFLGPLGGITADFLVRYKYLTIRGVRTLFYALGCLLAGFFILMVGYYARVGEAVAFLILGVGFSGLNAVGYAVNHLDIAPRYAGILMGVSNTFASIPGFLSPMLTGHIAKNKKASEWKTVFWITFIVYVVSVALYTVMCSGKRQWWAEGYPKDEAQENLLRQQQDETEDEYDGNNEENLSPKVK